MTPSKRGLTVLAILLLMPLAFATHSATITSNYNPIYETNPINVTLTVNNGLFSTSSINEVDFLTNGFSVNSIVQLLGWTLTNNNSINFLTNTNAISNWGSQNFGFAIYAVNVNQDTTYDWTITTTDVATDSQNNIVQFQVLNDNTPPVITGTTPGSFILGTNSELFSINANDPETGISNSNLYLSNCDLVFNSTTNSSSIVYSTIPLSCSNNLCSSTQDLTSWNEGDLCFYYDVSNRGGETATTSNLMSIIDRTPPSVNLISPVNNSFLNVTSVDLTFNAVDNYDNNLDCNVVVNGNPNVITGTGNLTYNLAVTDGVYSWSASCTDDVALTGTSSSNTFTVDNSAPNITISVPSVNNRGSDVTINTTITDAGSGVDQNSISATITDTNNNITSVSINNNQIIYSTSVSTIPGTYIITISANDNLGHSTTQQTQFRIRETYIITLSLSQSQIDASTPNITRYVNLTGSIVRDDGLIPNGTVDVIEILNNEVLNITNGNFFTTVEIPQTNGGYSIIASYINGIDTFTGSALITVGPYCGNGFVDVGEQCDGSNFNGQSCSNYGFSQGSLSCSLSCTINSNQCSNPPPQSSGSGGSGGGSSSGSNPTFIQQIITPTEPLIIEEPHSSGIIEPVIETHSSGIIETTEPQTGFGIGASWGVFSNLSIGMNWALIITIIIIVTLLYIFGWKKEDEWDKYFRRYGHK